MMLSLLRCCCSSWMEQEKRKMNCTDWDVVPWISRGGQYVWVVEYTSLSRKDKNSISVESHAVIGFSFCACYTPHHPMLLLFLVLAHSLQHHCQMGRDVGEGWLAHHLLSKPFHYFISSLLVVVYNSSGKWMMMQLNSHSFTCLIFPTTRRCILFSPNATMATTRPKLYW